MTDKSSWKVGTRLLVINTIVLLGAGCTWFCIMVLSFELQWVPFPYDTLQTLTTDMTESDVSQVLGAPSEIRESRNGKEWIYETWWSWGHAKIYFDENGKFTWCFQDDF
jgi:hypothetical protein